MNSISAVLKDYQAKRYSPTELVKELLEKTHKEQADYHHFITITDELALEQATYLETRTNSMSSLFGIPVSWKDSIDIKNIKTTNGSAVDKDEIATKHARVFETLTKQGVISIGKNNMDEFGTNVLGLNPHYGNVLNSINPGKTSGGSSSGSAVAVAKGHVLASVGTDTSGSIRVPAACNGIVGMKPTCKLIPTEGIQLLSPTLDHVGILTKSVSDLHFIMNRFMKKNPNKRNGLTKSTVKAGFSSTLIKDYLQDEVSESYEKVIKTLKNSGVILKDIHLECIEDDLLQISRTIGTSEMYVEHKPRFQEKWYLYSEDMKKVFNKGKLISAYDYLLARKKQQLLTKQLSETMKNIDVLIIPTMKILTPNNNNNKEQQMQIGDQMVSLTHLTNLTGHPTISIPTMIEHENIPFSIQLISHYNHDEILIEVAEIIEKIVR